MTVPPCMTLAGADSIERTLLDGVRSMFTDNEVVSAHAMVFSRTDPKSGDLLPGSTFAASYLPADFTDPRGSKEKFSAVLKLTCRTLDAFAVAFVSESWIATGPGAQERVESGGTLQEHPGREEAVLVSLEHCSYRGARCWTAEIERGTDGSVRLLDWKQLGGTGSGRFANLLPGAGGN